jgi:hypothetical protein
MTPAAMRAAKTLQPTQKAKTDSSTAKTTMSAVSTAAAVVQPRANAETAATVVTTAPIVWANRFGGPGT